MVIGETIKAVDVPVISEITDIVPVIPAKDEEGEDIWQVTDSSDYMMINGKDILGNEASVIINKESELITDLL
jgi:hypothetical protein